MASTPISTAQAKAEWQQLNLQAIHNRLQPILADPELATIITSDFQGVFLRRWEETLELYCYNQETNTLSEIMSRIDLTNPLRLVAEYSQAVMLSAGWQHEEPRAVYIAGFGGGRLSMVLHHLFPDLQIDGSDIDQTMISVCENYFGVEFDSRHDIRVADSRTDLATRSRSYDIVILDVFFGEGEHPNHLATVEFIEECQSKMTKDGVLVANFVNMDPHHQAKIAAIASVFPYCMVWKQAGAHVVFGSHVPTDIQSLTQRLKQRIGAAELGINVEERANQLVRLKQDTAGIAPMRDNTLQGKTAGE